jgi:hypothetical protein
MNPAARETASRTSSIAASTCADSFVCVQRPLPESRPERMYQAGGRRRRNVGCGDEAGSRQRREGGPPSTEDSPGGGEHWWTHAPLCADARLFARGRVPVDVAVERADRLRYSSVASLSSRIACSRRIGSSDALSLRGDIAIATRTYCRFREIFYGDAFAALTRRGARVQRRLWASTGNQEPFVL